MHDNNFMFVCVYMCVQWCLCTCVHTKLKIDMCVWYVYVCVCTCEYNMCTICVHVHGIAYVSICHHIMSNKEVVWFKKNSWKGGLDIEGVGRVELVSSAVSVCMYCPYYVCVCTGVYWCNYVYAYVQIGEQLWDECSR